MSATPLLVALVARIAREVPQVRYVKIEVPQAASKLRTLAAATGDALPGLFDGEEA
jgi:2-keto-3-deoxy-L-arabinonate dehydratase